MSKVHRIDIKNLTSNAELVDNNFEDERFSVDSFMEESTSNIETLVSIIPEQLNVFSDGFQFDEEQEMLDDFNLTRKLTHVQLKVLTEALNLAYMKFKETGDLFYYDRMVNASNALETAKRSILNAHKDKVKIEKDSGVVQPIDNKGGTVNIQNNTFHGTPDDMLKRFGESLPNKVVEED